MTWRSFRFAALPGCWLLLWLITGGCGGPPAPCQGDGIGPLSDNFHGYQCKHTCECNNQGFYGVCQKGVCQVWGPRPSCVRAGNRREVLVRNRFFSQECPSVSSQQRATCPSGAFDKTCQGKGLQAKRWGNCRCVGPLCAAGKVLCDTNCRPEQPCTCVDLSSDSSHCGACGNKCPAGSTCQKGSCVCPQGKTLCATSCDKPPCARVCVDLTQSSDHCGACGKACPQGGLCAQSACQEVPLAAGSYIRGTREDVMDWDFYHTYVGIPRYREQPHYVTLTRPFFLGSREVTRGWFKQVTGYDPSDWKCAGDPRLCPVHHVNQYQAMDFCNKLSQQRGLEQCYQCDRHAGTLDVHCEAKPEFWGREMYRCKGYRLPTDAEWEFAVRAGSNGVFHEKRPPAKDLPLILGKSYKKWLDPIAWYVANSKERFHPVATKEPNPWGLYDMLGNANEWVWEVTNRFFSKDLVDPYGETVDPEHSFRGGNILFPMLLVRNGFRGTERPSLRYASDPDLVSYFGFRIARTSPLANESCSRLLLSSCGSAGCKDTRNNPNHCGYCGHKCSSRYVCQQGQCITSEVEVPTKQKDGSPIVWTRGFLDKSREKGGFCGWRDAPPHKAAFTYRFAIQRYEVRQRDFEAISGHNPSRFRTCKDCPVDSVTWYQALAYANMLSRHKGLEECYDCTGDFRKTDSLSCKLKPKFAGANYYKCRGYRLPTEAEWEFAALAGGKRKDTCAAANNDRDVEKRKEREAWGHPNSNDHTRPAGMLAPNELGLYDMLGNVKEWVWSVYQPYPIDPSQPDKIHYNPIGSLPAPPLALCLKCSPTYDPSDKKCAPCFRVYRGGDFLARGTDVFAETRRYFFHLTKLRHNPFGHLVSASTFGFRLVRTIVASP